MLSAWPDPEIVAASTFASHENIGLNENVSKGYQIGLLRATYNLHMVASTFTSDENMGLNEWFRKGCQIGLLRVQLGPYMENPTGGGIRMLKGV